jgi:hypothetical protein
VGRVDAEFVAAFVVDVLGVGDGADEQRVEESLRAPGEALVPQAAP